MSSVSRFACVLSGLGLWFAFCTADCALSQLRGPCLENSAATPGCPMNSYKGCQLGHLWDDTCENNWTSKCCPYPNTSCGLKVDPATCDQVIPTERSTATYERCKPAVGQEPDEVCPDDEEDPL